jgi:hypothetical protein
MNYWLNLFTGTTWREFQKAGTRISGFRKRQKRGAGRIESGDVFLCYMVGVSRWVGALEVVSGPFEDDDEIFGEETFPVRFEVRPLVILPPEQGVPMQQLQGKLSFYPQDMTNSRWSGAVRGSLRRYESSDGAVIMAAVKQAQKNPVVRPVEERDLKRPVNLYKMKLKQGRKELERVVSIPTGEGDEDRPEPHPGAPTHTEIQWRLLNLGEQMGLDTWAPRRDRSKSWQERTLADVPRMRSELPAQFDANTNRVIEEIDVLWLQGQRIVAAFEVEHTTSVFSGLLRMSDLLTMQPNITIKLYIVGPDDRQAKFQSEVARPTFAARQRPLHSLCRFLPYSKLCTRLEEAKNVLSFLKPEFLDDIAQLYDPEEAVGD